MKHLLPFALLAALSGPAAAEWTALGGNDEITFYADTASVSRGGATSTILALVGSKTPRSQGAVTFSSILTKFEFDCAGQRLRPLETAFHTGALADGAVVASVAEPGSWEPVVEGSVKQELAQLACPK